VRSIVDSVREKRYSLISQPTHPSSSVIAFYIAPRSVHWTNNASDGQNTSKIKHKKESNEYRTEYIIIEAEGIGFLVFVGVVDISKYILIATNPPPHRDISHSGHPLPASPPSLLTSSLDPSNTMAQLKRGAPASGPRRSIGGATRGGATNVARRGGATRGGGASRGGAPRPSTSGAQRTLQTLPC
jgi:hypothetical protein